MFMRTHLCARIARQEREVSLCGDYGELTPDRNRADCLACQCSWDALELLGLIICITDGAYGNPSGVFYLSQDAFPNIEFTEKERVEIARERLNKNRGSGSPYFTCVKCGLQHSRPGWGGALPVKHSKTGALSCSSCFRPLTGCEWTRRASSAAADPTNPG